jgi:glycosyltransferase involved in cell wall biosynthesis
MTISALIPVYNEEKRIEAALKCIQWCDEIVVIDKFSTDKTVEIAKALNVKVCQISTSAEFTAEIDLALENTTSEWIISFTASDIIHPVCALEIKRLISQPDFDYDVIQVPFRRYVLGLESKRSPWYSSHAPMVFRKSIVRINRLGIHNAVQLDSNRHYKMKNSNEYAMYHLTHATLDGMMSRHLRYWNAEAVVGEKTKINKSFLSVLKSLYVVLVLRRSYLMGWKGVMLGFAYLTYFMMAFVYKWERKYSKAPSIYEDIKNKILSDWEQGVPKKDDNKNS